MGEHGPVVSAEESHRKGISVQLVAIIGIVLVTALSCFAIVTVFQVLDAVGNSQTINDQYTECRTAAEEMLEASDLLTAQSRMYVVTGDIRYLQKYLEELTVDDRRGQAITVLRENLQEGTALDEVNTALDLSNELAETELHAMKLAAAAYEDEVAMQLLSTIELDAKDESMPTGQKLIAAEEAVLGVNYEAQKLHIDEHIERGIAEFIDTYLQKRQDGEALFTMLLNRMIIVIVASMIVELIAGLCTIVLVIRPLSSFVTRIRRDDPLVPSGASEMRYFADAYNVMYEANSKKTAGLRYAAEHDALTGLSNRGAFDDFMAANHERIALLLIDVDHFKLINDQYGHKMGDDVLKKVANALLTTFRSSDVPCRFGGDEFAVIMTRIDNKHRDVVVERITGVRELLEDGSDGMPLVTISVGAAFSGDAKDENELFQHADAALYQVKESGRNGLVFHEYQG